MLTLIPKSCTVNNYSSPSLYPPIQNLPTLYIYWVVLGVVYAVRDDDRERTGVLGGIGTSCASRTIPLSDSTA